MPTKTEDGKQFERSAYLVNSSDNVSEWKLRIESEPGQVTVAQLGNTAAALSPSGFRGNRVDLSPADRKLAARKLITLYHKHTDDEADVPDHLYATAGMAAPHDSEDTGRKSLSDTLITFGDALKAIDDDGGVGGYLVRFGGRDMAGEYYTPQTYLGPRDGDGADCLFHHSLPIKGVPDELTDHLFTPIKTKRDDVGIWAETVLNMADDYEAKVYAMVKTNKLGWSSGSGAHLVRTKSDGEITRWPIVEGSMTPKPADWRNRAIPLKSLIDGDDETALIQRLSEPHTLEDYLQAVSALPVADHADAVVSAVKAFNDRMAQRADFRATKDGRVLSEANLTKIQTVGDHLDAARGHIKDMLEAGKPKKSTVDGNELLSRWLYNDAKMTGAIL